VRLEERDIAASRDHDPDWLIRALALEVEVEPLAKATHLCPYDAVVRRIVIARPAKNPLANILFAELSRPTFQGDVTDINKEARKTFGLCERGGRDYASDQIAIRIGDNTPGESFFSDDGNHALS
jgi:hypothetical protein